MRMMLGFGDKPMYLIDVEPKHFESENFPFEVVNGAHWAEYRNGWVHSQYVNPFKVDILSKDQNRLRGSYLEVFNNWDNPDYRIPVSKVDMPPDWDDNIPF